MLCLSQDPKHSAGAQPKPTSLGLVIRRSTALDFRRANRARQPRTVKATSPYITIRLLPKAPSGLASCHSRVHVARESIQQDPQAGNVTRFFIPLRTLSLAAGYCRLTQHARCQRGDSLVCIRTWSRRFTHKACSSVPVSRGSCEPCPSTTMRPFSDGCRSISSWLTASALRSERSTL
jgi:hypothetical protein